MTFRTAPPLKTSGWASLPALVACFGLLAPGGHPVRAQEPPQSAVPTHNPALEAVALVQTTGMGVGGQITVQHRGILLFVDGTASRALEGAPVAPAPADVDNGDPRDHGRWRVDDGVLGVVWGDGESRQYRTWWRARPAPAGFRMEGNFRAIGGGGNIALGGDVMITAWSTLEFASDGTFRAGSGAGATTPGIATGGRRDSAGRYEIDGHTITMIGADGERTVATFFLFPDSDDALGIGRRVYSRRR